MNGRQVVHASGAIIFVDEMNLLHRDADQPAVICADGSQAWFDHGCFIAAYPTAYGWTLCRGIGRVAKWLDSQGQWQWVNP
jgi:hypothetical protein